MRVIVFYLKCRRMRTSLRVTLKSFGDKRIKLSQKKVRAVRERKRK